jgi:hypothetical protein
MDAPCMIRAGASSLAFPTAPLEGEGQHRDHARNDLGEQFRLARPHTECGVCSRSSISLYI